MLHLITVDLRKEGLTHARGKADGCGGNHEIEIDPSDFDLHPADAWYPADLPAAKKALQRMHEVLHPSGTVYVSSCYEPDCQELAFALSLTEIPRW